MREKRYTKAVLIVPMGERKKTQEKSKKPGQAVMPQPGIEEEEKEEEKDYSIRLN